MQLWTDSGPVRVPLLPGPATSVASVATDGSILGEAVKADAAAQAATLAVMASFDRDIGDCRHEAGCPEERAAVAHIESNLCDAQQVKSLQQELVDSHARHSKSMQAEPVMLDKTCQTGSYNEAKKAHASTATENPCKEQQAEAIEAACAPLRQALQVARAELMERTMMVQQRVEATNLEWDSLETVRGELQDVQAQLAAEQTALENLVGQIQEESLGLARTHAALPRDLYATCQQLRVDLEDARASLAAEREKNDRSSNSKGHRQGLETTHGAVNGMISSEAIDRTAEVAVNEFTQKQNLLVQMAEINGHGDGSCANLYGPALTALSSGNGDTLIKLRSELRQQIVKASQHGALQHHLEEALSLAGEIVSDHGSQGDSIPTCPASCHADLAQLIRCLKRCFQAASDRSEVVRLARRIADVRCCAVAA